MRPQPPWKPSPRRRVVGRLLLAAVATASAYVGVVTGRIHVDLGLRRRVRRLGPQERLIAAPRDVVFDVVAAPYLEHTPRALAGMLRVLESGSDYALAAHRTPTRFGLAAVTVELVRFERPERVAFLLVRGPEPHVTETFTLAATSDGTRLRYEGELGTDLGWLGERWGALVAARWGAAVARSLDSIAAEAERRSRRVRPASG